MNLKRKKPISYTYKHLVHNNSQGPTVASRSITCLQKHFRCDVVWSAHRAVSQRSPVSLPALGSPFAVHCAAASTPA